MRKYIIVPVFLAVVLVMMCHCTSDRKATVPANEYLIQGELANLSDSIVIGLYVDEGNIFNLVARDTLLNGKFSFRDTVSVTKKMLIMSDNKGFPGTWLEVWIAPGVFIDHAGDQEFEKKGWAKIDSIRKLTTPLQQEIWKKELEYMKEAPISKVWIDKLLLYASMMKYETVMPYKEEVKSLYARMPETEKQTDAGQEITAYIYPPSVAGIGDMMVDGELYDVNDSLRHISEFAGRFILLDFWSSGCGPCVESIPEMEKVIDTYKDRMTVISISEDPKARWKAYVKTKGMGGNQWNELRRGRTGLAVSYQVKGIPHYVLIAPSGKIQDMWSGYGSGSLLETVKKNLK